MQDWQPPCEQADLLVLPTHSDDEYVFLGGVIPKYVDAGYTVQAVCLVDHRVNERLDSLWEAGVRNYPVVSTSADIYLDSLEAVYQTYGESYVTGCLVEQIRRFSPLAVVGQAQDGDSGHMVHIFYVAMLRKALELSNDPDSYSESYEKHGGWDVPKTYLHMYGNNMITLDFETPLDSFDGRTAFEVAEDAFERCVTQYAAGKYTVYGPDSRHDCRLFGLYRSLVGEDTVCEDLLENIPENYRETVT